MPASAAPPYALVPGHAAPLGSAKKKFLAHGMWPLAPSEGLCLSGTLVELCKRCQNLLTPVVLIAKHLPLLGTMTRRGQQVAGCGGPAEPSSTTTSAPSRVGLSSIPSSEVRSM